MAKNPPAAVSTPYTALAAPHGLTSRPEAAVVRESAGTQLDLRAGGCQRDARRQGRK